MVCGTFVNCIVWALVVASQAAYARREHEASHRREIVEDMMMAGEGSKQAASSSLWGISYLQMRVAGVSFGHHTSGIILESHRKTEIATPWRQS